MPRIDRVTAPSGAESVNSPLSLVAVTIDVPTTDTLARATGSPLTALVTRPVMVRMGGRGGWAAAASATRESATRASQLCLITVPPYRCAAAIAEDVASGNHNSG